VETVKVIFSLWPSDPFNFTLALFFFEANMTDESFPTPGAALEGWEGGRAVYFQKESDTPVSPAGVNAPYFRVSTTVARPFNLTAGTYFVSVATYGNTMQPATYPYRVAGSPTDGAYYPIYLGFNRSSSLYPGSTQSSDYATNTWAILNTTTNVVPCLWYPPPTPPPPIPTPSLPMLCAAGGRSEGQCVAAAAAVFLTSFPPDSGRVCAWWQAHGHHVPTPGQQHHQHHHHHHHHGKQLDHHDYHHYHGWDNRHYHRRVWWCGTLPPPSPSPSTPLV
jgi:hypothetical protein